MRLLKLVGLSPSRLVATALGLLAWWAVVGYQHGRIVLWVQVEAQLAASSLVVAAVATVWSGVEWQAVWAKAEEYVPPRSLAGGYLPWLTWVGGAIWMAAGIAVGAALGVWGVSGMLAGRPNPMSPLTWLAVVFAFTGVGSLIGRISPRLLGPLLAGMVVYGGLGFVMYGSTDLRNLMPIADGTPRIGYAYSPGFLSLQVVFLATVAGLATMLAAAFRSRRMRWWTLAAAAVVLVAGLVLTTVDPIRPVPVQQVCGGSVAAICGPEPMTRAIVAIDRVVGVFEATTGLDIGEVAMTDGPSSFARGSGELTLNTGGLRGDPVQSTARVLFGPVVPECENALANQIVVEAVAYLADPREARVSDISRRVARQLDGGDWLRRHWEELRECAVPLEDVPGVG